MEVLLLTIDIVNKNFRKNVVLINYSLRISGKLDTISSHYSFYNIELYDNWN